MINPFLRICKKQNPSYTSSVLTKHNPNILQEITNYVSIISKNDLII